MRNIVLFGPPGAGKGTQADKLIKEFDLVHLSTGDLLRDEIKRGTELGNKAKSLIDAGKLVPDDVVVGMIEKKLDDNANAEGFIFDGFPRTEEQAKALDELLEKKNTQVSGLVALQVPEEELIKRLKERGESSGRSDDKDENVIKDRIQEYENKTAPLADYYDQQGKFYAINGVGRIEEIFDRIKEVVKQFS